MLDSISLIPMRLVRSPVVKPVDDVWCGLISRIAWDALDSTPVLDIKPYVRELAPREATHQAACETELMSDDWNEAST